MNQAEQIAGALLDGENLKTFLGRHPKEQFRTGDSVYVIPVPYDTFDQEFMGKIVGKRGIYFQVSDQDGNAFDCLPGQLKRIREDRENIKQFLTRHKVRREGFERQLKNLGFLELLDRGSFMKKIKMTPYDYAMFFLTPGDESSIILHYELHKDHETVAHDRVDVSFEHGITPKLFASFLKNFIAHVEKARDIAPAFDNFRIGLHMAFSNLENALFRATHRP